MSIKNNYPIIRPSLDLNFAGSKTVDPRVTFTRASTATYYDGKTVAKAEENLLKYSQAFDNAWWIKNNTTVVANSATAPDKTSTACQLTFGTSGDSNSISKLLTISAGVHTASVYVKAGTATTFRFAVYEQLVGRLYAEVDLSAGSITSTTAGATSTITSVGDGWYRVTLTRTFATTNTGHAVQYISTAASVAGQTLLLWGAQLEQRDQATAYTPTTDQPITRYQPVLMTAPANTPRIDHDPITGECKGLLIEEQRTNLLLRSQEFNSTAWAKNGTSILDNAAIAVDGSLTAEKFIESATVGTHVMFSSPITVTQNVTYTATVYAKAGERTFLNLSFSIYSAWTGNNGASARFDLINGTANWTGGAGTALSITHVGNGWYRCSITAVRTGETSTTSFAIGIYSADGITTNYSGDGYSGIYIWGAQLETGAFPTSYISTASAQVTRAADNAAMTGTNFSSWYRQDEGTIVVVADRVSQTSVAAVGDGTFQNSLAFANQNLVRGAGGGYSPTISLGNLTAGPVKVAVALKDYDIAAAISGAAPLTNTSNKLLTMSKLNIGQQYDGPGGSVSIKRLAYYPNRLSNAQLQALTL